MKAATTFLLLIMLLAGQETTLGHTRQSERHSTIITAADRYFRTELYFGRSKPDGSLVTDDEWKIFLDKEVTPRFPDGFTVLDGSGQYRDKSGTIVKEPSKVLIVLYPKKDRKTSRAKIDEIRAAYVKQFNQESVLRVDLSKTVQVSF